MFSKVAHSSSRSRTTVKSCLYCTVRKSTTALPKKPHPPVTSIVRFHLLLAADKSVSAATENESPPSSSDIFFRERRLFGFLKQFRILLFKLSWNSTQLELVVHNSVKNKTETKKEYVAVRIHSPVLARPDSEAAILL